MRRELNPQPLCNLTIAKGTLNQFCLHFALPIELRVMAQIADDNSIGMRLTLAHLHVAGIWREAKSPVRRCNRQMRAWFLTSSAPLPRFAVQTLRDKFTHQNYIPVCQQVFTPGRSDTSAATDHHHTPHRRRHHIHTFPWNQCTNLQIEGPHHYLSKFQTQYYSTKIGG